MSQIGLGMYLNVSQEEAEILNSYRQMSREKRLVAQGVLIGLNLQEK